MNDFGFFTKKGEQKADLLIDGICIDIENDSITRMMSLERLTDALESIATIDQGAEDLETISKIIDKINTSFEVAGYVPVTIKDYHQHVEKYRNQNSPSWAGIPVSVAKLASLSALIMDSVNSLKEKDMSVSFSEVSPWDDLYDTEDSHISIFTRAPQDNLIESTWYVGCLILGEHNSQYLDLVMSSIESEKILKKLLPGFDNTILEDMTVLEKDLHRLNKVLMELSSVSGNINRLGVEYNDQLVITWDGTPVTSDASNARLAKSGFNSKIMKNIVFDKVDEFESSQFKI